MTRSNFLRWLIVLVALLCGCTINTSPSGNSASPSAQSPASPGSGQSAGLRNLNLSGRLIYTSGKVDTTEGKFSLVLIVQSLDLATGEVTTVFKAPPSGWIDSAAVSPDEQSLVMSYQPSSDTSQFGLYILPMDASRPPQLLFPPVSAGDRYYQPQWSPDGKYIYFTHIDYQTATTSYEIMRMTYPNGKLETLADNATWPRLSNDGSRLVYVSPATGVNRLFIANADGTGARQVPLTGSSIPTIIDAPMFLADNQTILFSAPVFGQSAAPSWADKLLGITVALADGTIPSDWWSVPSTGGIPKRLTHVQSLALFASFSPDEKHIASYSADGIFVMNPDGSAVTQVVNYTGGITGTVDWIR